MPGDNLIYPIFFLYVINSLAGAHLNRYLDNF